MCHPIPFFRAFQQAIPNNCTAKTLRPAQRMTLGLQALAGHQTITGLAGDAGVSREFVYQQADIAQAALDDAFTSTADDDQVLFHLPVTRNWLLPDSTNASKNSNPCSSAPTSIPLT